jgi:c-opsin
VFFIYLFVRLYITAGKWMDYVMCISYVGGVFFNLSARQFRLFSADSGRGLITYSYFSSELQRMTPLNWMLLNLACSDGTIAGFG